MNHNVRGQKQDMHASGIPFIALSVEEKKSFKQSQISTFQSIAVKICSITCAIWALYEK